VGDTDPSSAANPLGGATKATDVRANIPFVYITVDNMARSLTFYEHLGFTFPPAAFNEVHVEAELKNGLLIFWNHADVVRQYAPDYHPTAHGRIGLSFQLDGPGAVDRLCAKLKQLGYQVDRTPWDTPWGHRQAIVYDPDGNSLNLFAAYY
jgi:uncharacterized glyoxalase superfamily protein PhnB